MHIDKSLNIVIEIDREPSKIFVHSMPISREVFEAYFLPISMAFSKIYKVNLDGLAGPRVAALFLKSAAIEIGMWEGAQGVENGLLGEIVRLSNVVMPNPNGPGWVVKPMYNALAENLLSESEKSEVLGIQSFFTLAYHMHQKKWRTQVLAGLDLWLTHTTSLNVTEFCASLEKSIKEETTTETVLPPLSLPS